MTQMNIFIKQTKIHKKFLKKRSTTEGVDDCQVSTFKVSMKF